MTRIRATGASIPDLLLILLVYASGAGCAVLTNTLVDSGSLGAITFGQDSRWNVVSAVLVPLTAGTLAAYYTSGDDVAEMRSRVGSIKRLSAAARPAVLCSALFALSMPLIAQTDRMAALLAGRNFAFTLFSCALVRSLLATRLYLASGAVIFFASTFSGNVPEQGLLGIFYWDPVGHRDTFLSASFLAVGVVMFASSGARRRP